MKIQIRQYAETDLDSILEIAILAFTPIHESFQKLLGRDIFKLVYPDWKSSTRKYIQSLCEGKEREKIFVVEEKGILIGFISFFIYSEKQSGEFGINAIHPDHQNRGIGTMMYEHVLALMKKEEVRLVEVSTGGDISHAAARRAYEKCGFVPLPLVKYYKAL